MTIFKKILQSRTDRGDVAQSNGILTSKINKVDAKN